MDDVVIVNEFAVENGMVVAEIGINSTTKFRIVPHGYDHAACLWPPFSWWETVMFTRPVCRRSTAKLVRDDVYGKPFNLLRVSGDGSLSPRLTTLRIVFPHGLRWADARASKDHQLTLSVDLLTHSSYFRDCHALRTIACMQTDAVCVTFNPSTGDVVRSRPPIGVSSFAAAGLTMLACWVCASLAGSPPTLQPLCTGAPPPQERVAGADCRHSGAGEAVLAAPRARARGNGAGYRGRARHAVRSVRPRRHAVDASQAARAQQGAVLARPCAAQGLVRPPRSASRPRCVCSGVAVGPDVVFGTPGPSVRCRVCTLRTGRYVRSVL